MTEHMPESVPQKIRQLLEARDRALHWIDAHVDEEGAPVGCARFNGYYRLPWALAAAGRHDTAARVLGWIEQHALDGSGDWREGAPRVPFVHAIATYPHPQLVLGACLLGRQDLARRVLDVVRSRFIDPATGGAFSERPEVRRTGRTDLLCTAQAGLAALAVGDAALADGCHDWLARLLELQPEYPQRLYPCMVGGKLLREASQAHSAWDVVTDFHAPRQQYYNPGIAAAFLARHAVERQRPQALVLARDYLLMNVKGADLQFDHQANAQICKFGWGAATLLEATGAGEHLQQVLRMADWFRAAQRADGSWAPSPFLAPEPDAADCLPKTAEHLLHVVTLASALRQHA